MKYTDFFENADLPDSSGSGKYVVYHGTGTAFKKFSLAKSTQGIIWFTSDKNKVLNNETGAESHGYIITAEITLKNPAGWKEYEQLLLFQLKTEKYDGAILPDGNGDNFDCFVFNPNQIKILKVEKIKP